MMTFALLLLACGDAPVDSGGVEPVLYGTIEEPCNKGDLAEVSVQVALPDLDGLVYDTFYCYTFQDDRERCDPIPDDRWHENHDGGVLVDLTVECFNRNRMDDASEDVVTIDWMAPNPDW